MKQLDSTTRWLALANGLMDCPTAPLMEDLPARHVAAFARARPKLQLRRDAVGNMLVRCPNPAAKGVPPLVLVAHMDHPGFWVEGVRGKRLRLKFQGGVFLSHVLPGTGLRFFSRGQKDPIGLGKIVRPQGKKRRLEAASAVLISGAADPHGFAMWDFPGFSVRNGKIIARCCDDLLGAAVMLCVLDECVRMSSRDMGLPVWALFTRAEEIGFYGALSAVKAGLIPKRTGVISLECSKALADAPQGGGVIVRVGDRASIFDPFYSECLTRACMALKKKDPSFKFQRKLMDGGTCEASVFCNEGFRCSGLALPLGNYHNQAGLDRGQKRIAAETVCVDDFASEVRLLLELVRRGRRLEQLATALPKALEQRACQARKAFRSRPLLLES